MARKDGINPLIIVAIAVGAILFLGTLGGVLVCVISDDKSDETADETAETDEPRPVAKRKKKDSWITAKNPYVKFKRPAGWKTVRLDTWGVFKSPDGHAVFTFTTFDRAGEATAKIGKAVQVLGVTRVFWRSSMKRTRIGRDRFPARMGEGYCNYRGPGGYVWYATVNPGGYAQILLMYTKSSRGSKAHADAAIAAIKSLQRR